MENMMHHNNPPDQLEELAMEHGDLLSRKDALLEAADRAPQECDDDETAGKLIDFTAQIMACLKEAKDAHKSEKEPHLRAGQTVDGFFREITAPLEERKKIVEQLTGGYQWRKQEEARKAAAEAERAAREEAQRLAATATTEAELTAAIESEAVADEHAAVVTARPISLSRVRGSMAVGSLRTDYDYAVDDLAQVPRHLLMLNDSAVKAHIKARPKDAAPSPLPGIRFFPKHSTRARA